MLKMLRRLMFVIIFLLAVLPVWADASEPLAAAPPPEGADALPFEYDPFDENQGGNYGDEGERLQMVADPLAGLNRVVFSINDKFYFWVLKPVASGYRVVVPTPVRASVKNFFFNLLGPVRFVNCLLQGKFESAGGEFRRFMVNSLAGCLGFYNLVEDQPSFNPPPEDFGQTLGYHNVGDGFYIVWPLFGPSTLRDTVGSVGDWALNPFAFMKLINVDAGALTSSTGNVVTVGVRTVNEASFRIGDYETMKEAALDPYEAFRNAYIQHRLSKIAQ